MSGLKLGAVEFLRDFGRSVTVKILEDSRGCSNIKYCGKYEFSVDDLKDAFYKDEVGMVLLKENIEVFGNLGYVSECRGEIPSSSKRIHFEKLTFNDGTMKISIDKDSLHLVDWADKFIINCHAKNLDDIMVVGLLVDCIRNLKSSHAWIDLLYSSPMYLRYDRKMHKDNSDAFGARVLAHMLKATGISDVVLVDAHSDVIFNLLDNMGVWTYKVNQINLCQSMLDINKYSVVCPDSGAEKKVGSIANVFFTKDREPQTGVINGIVIKGCKAVEDKPYLIMDDICEKGGTFLGIVRVLKESAEYTGNPISLYVTHGVFPEGTPFNELRRTFEHIYVYNMPQSAYTRIVRAFGGAEKITCKNVYID